MKKKLLLFPLLIAFIISTFTFSGRLQFGAAQAGTNVVGIITSSTNWTKADSPYTLTGPVAVNTGVTLTIEAGTLVNLNDFYIQVNGTLIAIGSDGEKISFNNGEIVFTYTEAKELGIRSSQTFYRVIKELVEEKGFINMTYRGNYYDNEPNKFGISERWKHYGTDRYEKVEIPRILPKGIGFKKQN